MTYKYSDYGRFLICVKNPCQCASQKKEPTSIEKAAKEFTRYFEDNSKAGAEVDVFLMNQMVRWLALKLDAVQKEGYKEGYEQASLDRNI